MSGEGEGVNLTSGSTRGNNGAVETGISVNIDLNGWVTYSASSFIVSLSILAVIRSIINYCYVLICSLRSKQAVCNCLGEQRATYRESRKQSGRGPW